uniref:(northern house mosquito) hypothetical protein n=1 Tax=Culex pipiens TaxID=7175 RepID=A0A8D8IBR3_CULPI
MPRRFRGLCGRATPHRQNANQRTLARLSGRIVGGRRRSSPSQVPPWRSLSAGQRHRPVNGDRVLLRAQSGSRQPDPAGNPPRLPLPVRVANERDLSGCGGRVPTEDLRNLQR